jgi:protein-arginine kinase activator protein McsA
MICTKCELENTTLHWMETATGFVCIGCATGRRTEQARLDKKFAQVISETIPQTKPKLLGTITKVIID